MNGKMEIILVDDDEMTIFIHEKILKRCKLDWPFQSFRSAESCLEFLKKNHDPGKFFIILLDINMPGLGGWAMLDELENRNIKANCKVVMTTSSVDYEDRYKSQQYDIVIDFFEKPLSIEICESLANHPKIKVLT